MTKTAYIPSVKVPTEHASILSELIKLNDDKIEQLADIYRRSSMLLTDVEAVAEIAGILPEDFPYSSEQIQSILLSAATTVQKNASGKERVINDIQRKIEEIRSDGVSVVEMANLNKLLDDQRGIARVSDVREIYYAHDKAVSDFRIVTDVRPLFTEKENDLHVEDLMIYHNLQITYIEDGITKRTYYSLDSSDIRELLAVANRAVKKEAAISRKGALDKNVHLVGVN